MYLSTGLTCRQHFFSAIPKNRCKPYHTMDRASQNGSKKLDQEGIYEEISKKFSKVVEMIGIDSYNCYSDISIQSQTKYKPLTAPPAVFFLSEEISTDIQSQPRKAVKRCLQHNSNRIYYSITYPLTTHLHKTQSSQAITFSTHQHRKDKAYTRVRTNTLPG